MFFIFIELIKAANFNTSSNDLATTNKDNNENPATPPRNSQNNYEVFVDNNDLKIKRDLAAIKAGKQRARNPVGGAARELFPDNKPATEE